MCVKMMNCLLKTRNCVLKTRSYVLKMMDFADSDEEWSSTFAKIDRSGTGSVDYEEVSLQWKNPDFPLKNPDFLLKHVGFIIKQFKLWLVGYSKGAKEKIAHGKTEMLREAMAT